MKRTAIVVFFFLLLVSHGARGQYFEHNRYYSGVETHLRSYDTRWISTGDTIKTVNRGDTTYQVSGFWMLCYEVPRDLWNYYMGDSTATGDPLLPVTGISIAEIDTFCQRISKMTNLTWRLPTLEEWLFAYHGGMESEGYLYSGSNHPEYVAWYMGNSKGNLQPVAGRLPNEVGMYDMLGNAAEYVTHGDSTCVIGGCCIDSYPDNNANHLFTSPPPDFCGFRIVSTMRKFLEK